MKIIRWSAALALALFVSTAALAQTTDQTPEQTPAQVAAQPLPKNYKTIFQNADFLVMRVHYGPHEFVPMHDHSAYPTVFVYLNDSGVVRIDHDVPHVYSMQRPPTHTGAFRIAPGAIERHSVTNLSALPSDFLRVELKAIPPTAIKEVFRGPAPSPPFTPGVTVAYNNPALRIERILCARPAPCTISAESAPSALITIPLYDTGASGAAARPVTWLPAHADLSINIDARTPGAFEVLRIVLPGR